MLYIEVSSGLKAIVLIGVIPCLISINKILNMYYVVSLIKFGVPRKLVRLIKTCRHQSKVRIGNYLSSSFSIENDLKQGDALLPLIFNCALEYAIRKV